ncbi:hypothetical protein BC831DRAFT_482892 [Entophlyctis helioformis]|nr:hypothetical protein BC831DRAFT_482892 [Entophlyctis helioformis]
MASPTGQPLEQEPLTCSAWDAFDKAQLCFTVGPQFKHFYRFGTWKDCSPLVSDFTFCWSLRNKSEADAQQLLRERAEKKLLGKTVQRPSIDIWEVCCVCAFPRQP